MARKKYATKQQQQPKRTPKSGASEASDWRPWVLMAAAFLLFSTGLSNGLLGIDDHSATVDNLAVKNFDLTIFNLGMYAPLTWLAYAIAYHLGGDHPFFYHLLSLLVHVANVWLLYRLLQRLDLSRTIAFAVTLLFAIHPIQVESVAWIAGFSTPFFTLFCLLSTTFYLQHTATEAGSQKHYLSALGLFVAACLAKSTAVMLPLLLLVLDFYWKKPTLERRKQWLGYAPFFLLALGFGLLTFYTRAAAGVDVGATTNDFSVLERALVVCYTPLLYWSKLLLPLHLSIYYSFNKVNGALPIIYYLAPLILGGLVWAAWRYRQQAPYLWQGLLFYTANIFFTLPFYAVGTFELCADHYNYLAVVGFSLYWCPPGNTPGGHFPPWQAACKRWVSSGSLQCWDSACYRSGCGKTPFLSLTMPSKTVFTSKENCTRRGLLLMPMNAVT
ncbi:MAG: glycosyltransferase family 39 protein [Lewinellaceae bacterium]|nr:glycosyltransferase family 39 protein [Lewinellaceae bacterium]